MQQPDDTEYTQAIVEAREISVAPAADWAGDGLFTHPNSDLSAAITRVTVDRSISTPLPDQGAAPVGYAAAAATVELGAGGDGDQAEPASRFWSGMANVAATKLAAAKLTGAGLTVDTTIVPDDGIPRSTRLFTGQITVPSVSSANRTATLEAVDGREKMRGSATSLPYIVGWESWYVRPELNGLRMIDTAARESGFHSIPPPQPGCCFFASMHGSSRPEIMSSSFHSDPSYAQQNPQLQPGRWVEASGHDLVCFAPTLGGYNWNAWRFVVAGWTRNRAADGSQGYAGLFDQSGNTVFGLSTDAAAGTATVWWLKAPGAWWSQSVPIPDNRWVFFGAAIDPVSNKQVWLNITDEDGTVLTNTSFPLSAYPFAPPAQAFTVVHCGGPLEAVQALTVAPSAKAPDWTPWTEFVPTALLDRSLNTMVATPAFDDTDWWGLANQVADAEGGTVGFDEQGRFFFWNRRHGATVPVATLTADDMLTGLDAAVDISGVRNDIKVNGTPLTMNAPGLVPIGGEVVQVPAGGTTTFLIQQPPGIYTALPNDWRPLKDGSGAGVDPPTTADPFNIYRANDRSDGSGAPVTNLVIQNQQIDRDTVKLTINNPNGFAVWICNPANVASPQGSFAMGMFGIGLVDAPQMTGHATDGPSADAYGSQPYTPEDNRWRQTAAACQSYADDLLADLKDAKPVITSLTIRADPRLQLGDVVTVSDPDGLGAELDARLFGIRTDISPDGATQTLTARAL